MQFDYLKICQNLLKDLPERQREVIERRFGLKGKKSPEGEPSASYGLKETLEAIGKSWGVTRERVRQIEEAGFLKLKPKTKDCQKIFQYFVRQLKKSGDLKKETLLLGQLGGENYQNEVFFLLTLGEPFRRFSETKQLHSFWTINPDSLSLVQEVIQTIYNELIKVNQVFSFKKLQSLIKPSISSFALQSFLEISKQILKNQEGLFGLKDWPEINPRGVKDKAYLVFKKTKTPLHFLKVTELIGPNALSQTVHNELIKDPRFVLVGRGIYALREWGYESGDVKDIILKILQKAQRPLRKEEILEKVLEQRLVKENTILINLNNKKYFLKTPRGEYQIHPHTKFGVGVKEI